MVQLKIFCSCIFFLLAFGSSSQSFEGIIEFKFYTPIDTIHFIYYEKDGMVKIEEFGFDKSMKSFLVIDLNSMKATTFYPERQVFFNVENYFSGNMGTYDLKLEKGKRPRHLINMECQEWVVKSKTQNMATVFYTHPYPYGLSESFLPIMQKKDKVFKYFQQFPELKGLLPIFAMETGPGKNQRFAFEIISIVKETLEPSEFHFPHGYRRHE